MMMRSIRIVVIYYDHCSEVFDDDKVRAHGDEASIAMIRIMVMRMIVR